MDCDVQIKKEVEEQAIEEDFHSDLMVRHHEESGDLENFDMVLVKEENCSLKNETEDVVTELLPQDLNLEEKSETVKDPLEVIEGSTSNLHFKMLNNIIYESMLKCYKCPGTYFSNLQNLQDHCENFHGSCFKCNKILPPNHDLHNCKENFKILNYRSNSTNIVYECSTCLDVCFGTSKELQFHVVTVHGHKICSECDAILSSNDIYTNHINKHVTKVKCRLCNNIYFSSHLRLKNHLTTIHNYKFCLHCRHIFNSNESLIKHEQIKHPPVIENNEIINGLMRCPLCSYTCRNNNNFKEHKRKQHFRCNLCFIYFNTKLNLAQHYCDNHQQLLKDEQIFDLDQIIKIRKENGIPLRYPCRICSIYCMTKANFSKHYNKMHKSRKIYKCSKCDFTSYKSSAILSKHELKSHPKFICNICNRKFNFTKEKLELHISRHFKGILD